MSNPSPLTQLRTAFSTAHWPQFDSISRTEDQCVIAITINRNMLWLEGHFPQQPVVAGVVQTHWAGALAQYLFSLGDNFTRIDNLKFQQVILPGQSLQLSLDYSGAADSNSVKFRYQQGDSIFSEGKLVFHTQASPAQ